MGYVEGKRIKAQIRDEETNLLMAGFSYSEVARKTGRRRDNICTRNRLIYKIDIWRAFKRRVEREGIPSRLSVSDAFGYWFSGFFDGEGHIAAYVRHGKYGLLIRIVVRDDDAHTIHAIQNNLKVGHIHREKHHTQPNSNPSISWVCQRVKDLAETILPLFDSFPLQTKKAKEYSVWRPIVIHQYIRTLGGYCRHVRVKGDFDHIFRQGAQEISNIRNYSPVGIP